MFSIILNLIFIPSFVFLLEFSIINYSFSSFWYTTPLFIIHFNFFIVIHYSASTPETIVQCWKIKFYIFSSTAKESSTINLSVNHKSSFKTVLEISYSRVLKENLPKCISITKHETCISAVSVLINLYYAIVYPFHIYGLLVWGRTYPSTLNIKINLFILQKRCKDNTFLQVWYTYKSIVLQMITSQFVRPKNNIILGFHRI